MQHTRNKFGERGWKTRAVAMLMSVVMVFGLFPVPVFAYEKTHWAAPYMEKMEEWGVLRETQLQDPDKPMTRAEFMAVVNRAYGYTEKGEIPFTDVTPNDWFYEDVCIAYKANYIHGTSETTASPNETLTRETAAFILGKNMMLKEVDGENLSFTDGRDVSSWSRGTVKAAVQNYLIAGYDDGSFRPQQEVTLGEVAALISSCIGTPIRDSGDVSLGSVFGNVTITDSGVTLRDTTISGDLYITGGVGEGAVKLENVTVLGRIIDSGTGESESGQASVVMRNVIADELLVDNLRNEYVTLRTEGITQIGQVNLRTDTYLEDNTPQDYGLKQINVDGEEGLMVDLAGRIKNVTVESPKALVTAAKGTIQLLTVDETSEGTQVKVDRSAEIKQLNLDVGTNVTGKGDVANITVNAPGSTTEMLPDQIVIRPGLDANIAGEVMDVTAAEESSRNPKILSGYPLASDVAPAGLSAVFATNKKGTIYWAVSTIADGSVDADELISHPSYGSIAVKYGNLKVSGADVKVQAKVTGLTVGGAYYLSAVLVDDRGQQSPVKVTAFTTPDNTKPDFANGYPYMSYISDSEANATVMTTKSCKMYYALLPKGAAAPTVNEFKTGSVSGALGYGVEDVIKNTELDIVPVNNLRLLEEEGEYDLYLWLTDADGANSSAVKKVSFKTVDKTPPKFVMDPTVNKVQATSVGLVYTLNEAGTVYWVVVDEGATYPKPKPGYSEITPDDDYAKLQVASGLNAIKSGKVTATANKEGTLNITGLTAEKSYDLWYVAQDKAGNYTLQVEKLTIHTLDDSPPVVKQYFTKYSGVDNTVNPMPDTDIILEFSESIRTRIEGVEEGGVYLKLYEKVLDAQNNAEREQAKETLAQALEASIRFYYCPTTGKPELMAGRRDSSAPGDDWVIDYHNVTVTAKDGKVSINFPVNPDNKAESALNLASGATYYFELEDITDNSNSQNPIVPNPVKYDNAEKSGHILKQFTTVFAEVFLGDVRINAADLPMKRDESGNLVQATDENGDPVTDSSGAAVYEQARVDFQFRMDPQSTEKVEQGIAYDVLLWADHVMAYDVYYRIVDENTVGADRVVPDPAGEEDCVPTQNTKADANGWIWLGNSGVLVVGEQENLVGISLNNRLNGCDSANFPELNLLREDRYYDIAISLTQLGTSKEFDTWSGNVNMRIDVAAGNSGNLYSLSRGLNMDKWQTFAQNGLNHPSGAESIGITATSKKYYEIGQSFEDNATPQFANSKPRFDSGDTFVNLVLNMTRKGTIYYVLAPEGVVVTKDKQGNILEWDDLPKDGSDKLADNQLPLQLPDPLNIQDAGKVYSGINGVVYDAINYYGENVDITETVNGLLPETKYCAYFVLKGSSPDISRVYAYRFETTSVSKPRIVLSDNTDGSVNIQTLNVPTKLNYILFTEADAALIANLSSTMLIDNLSTDAAGKTLPAGYADYNILKAMSTTYFYKNAQVNAGSNVYYPSTDETYDGFSVFDVYAGEEIKNIIAEMIRNGTNCGGADIINIGSIDQTPTTPAGMDQELSNMKTETWYVLLTVGYHKDSEKGTGDAFKAATGLRKLDTDPPEFQDTETTIDDSDVSNPNFPTFSGTVSIRFDKSVYRFDEHETDEKLRVLPVYLMPAGSSPTGAVNLLDYLAISAGGKGTVKEHQVMQRPSSSFVLHFDNIPIGGTITMLNGVLIANSNGQSTQKSLTLTLKRDYQKNESGLQILVPYFEAKWGDQIIK